MFRYILLLGVISIAFGGKINVDERIVGGKDTTIEEHPYQVSIEYIVTGELVCGGSLIKPNVVLTAAHCTNPLWMKYYIVRAGSTLVERDGQVANVTSFHIHEKFEKVARFDYDVSVIILDRSFNLDKTVQTIELIPVGEEIPVGTLATITGWGSLANGGFYPYILQAVQVPKMDTEKCQKKYENKEIISPRMNCYAYDEGGVDACDGDSGGPLVINDIQVGIASWAYGCANSDYPGVYVNIADEEIRKHIDDSLKKIN